MQPTRSLLRLALLVSLAMLAFAANSLLCRLALRGGHIDAASFTVLRLGSGALVLALLLVLRRRWSLCAGNWLSALALFVYAAGFSFAYLQLDAASGALLLFGAVQTSMLGHGVWRGERLSLLQWVGVLLALTGLAILLLPGASAPPVQPALLMLLAGAGWALYSLRGRTAGDATRNTAGNFLRALVLALPLLLLGDRQADGPGWLCALLSGALASGGGYALWYAVLPALRATQAATIQLSVPLLTALAGVLLLDGSFGWRRALACMLLPGGVALSLWARHPR